jgi:hypothetical protein
LTVGGCSWAAYRFDREARIARNDSLLGVAMDRTQSFLKEARRIGIDDLSS